MLTFLIKNVKLYLLNQWPKTVTYCTREMAIFNFFLFLEYFKYTYFIKRIAFHTFKYCQCNKKVKPKLVLYTIRCLFVQQYATPPGAMVEEGQTHSWLPIRERPKNRNRERALWLDDITLSYRVSQRVSPRR